MVPASSTACGSLGLQAVFFWAPDMTDHITHLAGGCIRHHWRHMHDSILGWSFDASEQVIYWGA